MSDEEPRSSSEAGPSRPIVPVTPAPVRAKQPNAPIKPASSTIDIPSTPAADSTSTPRPADVSDTPREGSIKPLPAPDISEFDPLNTPAPASTAGASSAPSSSGLAAATPATPSGPSTRDADTVSERGGEGASSVPSESSFNFSGFLRDLRQKSAEPVARYLKSFLANFTKKSFTVNEQIKLIHDFLAFITARMREVDPWKKQSPAEFDNATEAMEKLVMNRLYNYTFTPQLVPSQPITTDDLERDAVFSQRVRLFGWVQEKHLDVPDGEASQGFLSFAEQELLKINHYKAPRDKMICILNCCKVIFGLIRQTGGAEATSADAFVPILIFVVLKANPDHMLSNIEYINRFRSPAQLRGEAGYYLSSLSGAIAFIETMDWSSLSNITKEEFEDNVEQAIRDLPAAAERVRSVHSTDGDSEGDHDQHYQYRGHAASEDAARPLALPTSPTIRAGGAGGAGFFQRTGNLASEAVSKPLSAISRIFDTLQESTPGASAPSQRPQTPDSPSRRFATMDLNDDPENDFTLQSTIEMSNETHAQAKLANIQTLHQMFPALDEEIVEAVLEGCGDDLGVAIDRLLEM